MVSRSRSLLFCDEVSIGKRLEACASPWKCVSAWAESACNISPCNSAISKAADIQGGGSEQVVGEGRVALTSAAVACAKMATEAVLEYIYIYIYVL